MIDIAALAEKIGDELSSTHRAQAVFIGIETGYGFSLRCAGACGFFPWSPLPDGGRLAGALFGSPVAHQVVVFWLVVTVHKVRRERRYWSCVLNAMAYLCG